MRLTFTDNIMTQVEEKIDREGTQKEIQDLVERGLQPSDILFPSGRAENIRLDGWEMISPEDPRADELNNLLGRRIFGHYRLQRIVRDESKGTKLCTVIDYPGHSDRLSLVKQFSLLAFPNVSGEPPDRSIAEALRGKYFLACQERYLRFPTEELMQRGSYWSVAYPRNDVKGEYYYFSIRPNLIPLSFGSWYPFLSPLNRPQNDYARIREHAGNFTRWKFREFSEKVRDTSLI